MDVIKTGNLSKISWWPEAPENKKTDMPTKSTEHERTESGNM